MSTVKLISPRQDLIQTVAQYLRPRDGSDYSRSVVVFPGKRPAHFLRRFLAERSGTSIIPPRIFSIDHFVEFMLREYLGVLRKVIDTVDAIAILHDVHLQLDPKLGGRSYASLDAFLPLATKLISELEELVLADISQRQLREAVGSLEYPKFHALADYYLRFYQELEQRGLLTRSTMYQTVAEGLPTVDLSAFDCVIMAGFYAFTNVEIRILSHLREQDHVVIVFQRGPGIHTQLHKLAIDIDDEEENVDVDPGSPDMNFYGAPDGHGQILALSAKLKERLDSGRPIDERCVIVLPSAEALFPVLHGPLSLVKADQFNISLGYPLLRTPVFGFLNSLMELASRSFQGKFSAHAYLRFVLHPYTKNVRFGSRSDVTRILFHRIEEFLVERKARLLLTLTELEGDESLYDFVMKGFEGMGEAIIKEDIQRHVKTIHDETIRRFLSFSSLGDLAQKSIDVLTFVFDRSTASLHPYFRPYAEEFISALDRIKSSLLRDKRFDTTTGYFTFLRQYIATETVPFPGTPLRGLQVLGLLETRNLKFDTLYMLDANDDIVPSKPAEDLLLPQPVRLKLGLETSRERERLSRYYFDLAIDSAREVHLFYTETGAGGKEKSRFVQKLIWDREREANRPLENELEQRIKYTVNLANRRPSGVPKAVPVVEFLRTWHQFSATQLDTYLACPLKFYYSTVLGLREKAEAREDVDQRDIGSFVHRILREYFSPHTGHPLRPEGLTEATLDAVVDRCFAEEYGGELLGPALLLRRQVQLQLRRFLQKYQLPLVESTQVVITGLEERLTAERAGIRFTGSIDRIEARDGKLFILDYKTGKDDAFVKIRTGKIELGDRDSWRKAIGSFQLPVYMLLHAETKHVELESITPAYLFLGRSELGPGIEVGIGSDEQSPSEVYRAVEPVMMKLIEEILDPGVPFKPTDHLEEDCPQCPYRAICGTSWTGGWKQ